MLASPLLAARAGLISSPHFQEEPKMKTLQERLDYCNQQIAQAIEESCRPQTEAEHLGILLWEMDWRAERDRLLAELTAQEAAA